MSAMFEFCCLRCEYAELHAPSSYGLDELLILRICILWQSFCFITFGVTVQSRKINLYSKYRENKLQVLTKVVVTYKQNDTLR